MVRFRFFKKGRKSALAGANFCFLEQVPNGSISYAKRDSNGFLRHSARFHRHRFNHPGISLLPPRSAALAATVRLECAELCIAFSDCRRIEVSPDPFGH